MIRDMRVPLLLAAAWLAACAQPAAHPDLVERARARAGLAIARPVQLGATRVLLAEPLELTRTESEGVPAYRIWSYDAAKDRAEVVLPRAQWAAYAGDALLAVEDDALVLHRGGATRTLLEHAAPDFAVDSTGQWVAAVVRRPELALDTDLVLLRAEGGPARPIAAFAGSSESRPIFTPDNRAVIFVSGRSGVASLYRVELKSGEVKQLTNVGLARVTAGFVPPPPDVAGMHFEGEQLVYASGGRTFRVNTGGPR